MTDYYCDISASGFVDRDGTDNTTSVLTGPAGLQAAIRGTGAATALAAGDRLYIRAGTGDLSRLVLIDCNGTSVTGWGIGDVVHNKDAASAWQGVVVETNSAAFLGADDLALVWLDDGYDEDNILVADGVTNDDASGGANDPTDIDPLAARSSPGIKANASGTSSALIKFIGVNISWVEDGDQAVWDGADKAASCLSNDAVFQYAIFRNITFIRGVDDNVKPASTYRYIQHVNCVFAESGSDGIRGASTPTYCAFDFCTFRDNVAYGAYASYSHYFGCQFYGNITGVLLNIGSNATECVFFENVTYGAYCNGGAAVNHSVFDNNGNGIFAASGGVSAVACRFTNNTERGVKIGSASIRDPYCFYSGNGSTEESVHDDSVRGVSTRVASGTIGYIDGDNATLAARNYGLTNQAAARRMEVAL
jgi:hypothetical protein